jgi:hypothetical protein
MLMVKKRNKWRDHPCCTSSLNSQPENYKIPERKPLIRDLAHSMNQSRRPIHATYSYNNISILFS